MVREKARSIGMLDWRERRSWDGGHLYIILVKLGKMQPANQDILLAKQYCHMVDDRSIVILQGKFIEFFISKPAKNIFPSMNLPPPSHNQPSTESTP